MTWGGGQNDDILSDQLFEWPFMQIERLDYPFVRFVMGGGGISKKTEHGNQPIFSTVFGKNYTHFGGFWK